VPSLFSTLLGVNITGVRAGAPPFAEITISILTMTFLGIFFYMRGWLSLN
jgi:hypothetical protein